LNYINEQLQYVFYSDKKAKLVAGDGCYVLKICGRDVPPKKISVGERNVLGLCYFFAKLFSNKKKEDRYKEEVLLIIDDPISSFDYGNRLGVMSLLRYQFNNIKNGNSNSRILVMTHDLRSLVVFISRSRNLLIQLRLMVYVEICFLFWLCSFCYLLFRHKKHSLNL